MQQALNGSFQQALSQGELMRLNFKKVADLAAGRPLTVFSPIYTWISKQLVNAERA